ncbi:MAG: type 1 glutamine amidotransferase [Chitinophagaceae bacterium]|nr:type 1 glutamine amidotransferase [Oligoflexus sp.]
MSKPLEGLSIAILSTDGFEQSELLEPRKALLAAGAKVHVVSPKKGSIKGWNEKNWGESVPVDASVKTANADDYDAIVLPGGVMNPDSLRTDKDALAFLQSFVDADKPIAAICHGPQTLIEIGAVKGRKMTSYHSLQTDLKNAGAHWVDEEVVEDRGLVTSRKPQDIPAFNKKIIEVFARAMKKDASKDLRKASSHYDSDAATAHA